MKKIKFICLASLAALILVFLHVNLGSSGLDSNAKLKLKLMKPTGTQQKPIAYNGWNYYMRNDGSYMYRASESKFGGEFPRGSNVSAVYAAGMYVGALKKGEGVPDTINVAQCEFTAEFLPGKILVNGEKDNKYRGYKTPNTGSDTNKTAPYGKLERDNDLSSEYAVYVIDQGASGNDWSKWPSYAPRRSDGSPFLLSGVAAQSYAVFNDMSIEKVKDTWSYAPGFGLEMELESFVFTAGYLNNGIFFKLSITNKTNRNYPGAYIGIWTDPDVGSDAGDDMAGVDTVRGLGVVYNNPDGADAQKIALGLDFLQGPLVDSSEVSTSLVRKFFDRSANRNILRHNPATGLLEQIDLTGGLFTLDATSFTAYPNGTGDPDGRAQGDFTRYYYLQGLDLNGNPKPNGPFDEGIYGRKAADQRIIHGTGPFILKAGQTQEIWMAFVAGLGKDKSVGSGTLLSPEPGSAVATLYSADDAMQISFDNALAAPGIVPAPSVNVTSSDNKVILSWDSRSEFTADTYGDLLDINPTKGYSGTYVKYDFQGYRVYKSLTGLTDSWNRVAQYDIIDKITTINDTAPDLRITYDIEIGTDNGLQYSYTDDDVINGRVYYYSVTAYDYQPLFWNTITNKPSGYPRSLECAMFGKSNLRSVVPMSPLAGFAIDAQAVDTLARVAGFSNGFMLTRVIHPEMVKNTTYTLVFDTIRDSVNGKPIRGISAIRNKIFFRFIDPNGDSVRILNYYDDSRTYIDIDMDGVYNDTIDKKFDEGYFSTSVLYKNLADVYRDTTGMPNLPIVDGIEYKIISQVMGVKDFIVTRTAAGPVANPYSVYHKDDPTGNFRIMVIGGALGTISTSLKVDAEKTEVKPVMNPLLNAARSDYEFRFITNPADSSNVYLGSLLQNSPGQILGGSFTKAVNKVPFQIWRIGITPDDASDDVRLGIKTNVLPPPTRVTGPGSAPPFEFRMDNSEYSFPDTNRRISERITVIDTAYSDTMTKYPPITDKSKLVASNFVFMDLKSANAYPPAGTVIRMVMFKPIIGGDKFRIQTRANSPFNKKSAKNQLKDIKVVPNPYYGRVLEYQASLFDKKVKFTNLPDVCTIRIFNIAGDLLRTIQHNGTSYNGRIDNDPLNRGKDISTVTAMNTSIEEWDLRTTGGSFVASGMYIALIEAKGVGKTTVKFAVIQEEMRIDGPDNR